MTAPWFERRESMTLFSSSVQNGHFISHPSYPTPRPPAAFPERFLRINREDAKIAKETPTSTPSILPGLHRRRRSNRRRGGDESTQEDCSSGGSPFAIFASSRLIRRDSLRRGGWYRAGIG